MQYMLQQHGDKQVVFLAMSVALAMQQYLGFLKATGISPNEVAFFYGGKTSAFSVDHLRVIFATPVVYKQMLESRLCFIHHCSLLVFDEVHHARKNHPYAVIMRDFVLAEHSTLRPHIFGMTASPGEGRDLRETMASIQTLCDTMSAELTLPMQPQSMQDLRLCSTPSETIIEIYDLTSSDAVFLDMISLFIKLSIRHVLELDRTDKSVEDYAMTEEGLKLKNAIAKYYLEENNAASGEYQLKFMEEKDKYVLRRKIVAELRLLFSVFESGEQSIKLDDRIAPQLIRTIQDLDEITDEDSLLSALLMAVINGWEALDEVSNFGADQALQSTQDLLQIIDIPSMSTNELHNRINREWNQQKGEIRAKIELAHQTKSGNGKVDTLLRYLRNMTATSRAIVFVQQRSTAVRLTSYLQEQLDRSVGVDCIVGKAGMSSAGQLNAARRFNEGAVRVLVATSVAEEGIDIQACNLVIRMDGTMTSKSLIQSRGRARHHDSRYVLIVAPEEKDLIEFVMRKEEFMLAAVRYRCDPGGLERDGTNIEKMFEEYAALLGASSTSPQAWQALHQYCQQSGYRMPEFEFIQNDENPSQRFTCIVKDQQFGEFKATGSTKNETKFKVANELWTRLSASSAHRPFSFAFSPSHSPLMHTNRDVFARLTSSLPTPSSPSPFSPPSNQFSYGASSSNSFASPQVKRENEDPYDFLASLHRQSPIPASTRPQAAPSSPSYPSSSQGNAYDSASFGSSSINPPKSPQQFSHAFYVPESALRSYNPIGCLQEMCQQAGAPLPVYDDLGQDPKTSEFVIICKLNGITAHGAGRQKKLAKTNAAASMLQALHQRRQQ